MDLIKCYSCGQEMSQVIYTYPTEEVMRLAQENNWVIGGCLASPIKAICKKCKITWSKNAGFETQT